MRANAPQLPGGGGGGGWAQLELTDALWIPAYELNGLPCLNKVLPLPNIMLALKVFNCWI